MGEIVQEAKAQGNAWQTPFSPGLQNHHQAKQGGAKTPLGRNGRSYQKQLDQDGILTLCMVDHGSPETFYIDELNGPR
ncbi:MAG: hypothetical protein AAF702_32315 [Chloroflexota bacterium]